ncbi:MAG: hypothetical protein LBS54_00820, partial [Dysgonamonadaceae bacterium]|nr:hypothetical protein [Dysgonamonadaceae bacterium]
MKKSIEFLILAAGIVTGFAVSIFNPENEVLTLAGSGVTLAFALAIPVVITEGLLANVRRWHGSIDDQFSNIDNLVTLMTKYQKEWIVPPTMLDQLTANRNALQTLISLCRSAEGSKSDRERRNALLKSTVYFCLHSVKVWVYQAHEAGALTDADVHALGFLLLGENGGRHERTVDNDVLPEVKVKIVNEDFVEVIIDKALVENAGPVRRGWPNGVKNA